MTWRCSLKSLSVVLVLCVFATFFAGCADMEFPTPKSMMKDSVKERT